MSKPSRKLLVELIDAAVEDHAKARKLLKKHPGLLEARYIHKETPLHFLAVEGYADGVRFLAEAGADVNCVNEFGDTPLADVACLGGDEVARILLQHGADPNAASSGHDNVLHAALGSQNAALVDALLSAGALGDYVTELGETVFDALPKRGAKRRSMLGVLEKHGLREQGPRQ